MMRLLMVALVGFVVSGPAWGADEQGGFSVYTVLECGQYLDAYAKATLTGDREYTGPAVVGTVVLR